LQCPLAYAALNHRSPAGSRPADGERLADIWISYNGEVYDWAAAADELKALGYRFRNRSDTEFILHAYERGASAASHACAACFAFTILDLRRRTACLVRDRMGLKPLVYAAFDGKLAFGSTVRSVLPFLPESKQEFSAEGIDAYLAHRYIPAPRTVFSSIDRLENGHYCASIWIPAVWRKCATGIRDRSRATGWKRSIRAVEMRTVADRPLGMYLSGGIDSTVIASRLAKARSTAICIRSLRPFPARRWMKAPKPGRSPTDLQYAQPCHSDQREHRPRFRPHRRRSG
jgi:asparagine synthase (glutamine-hydrolysing)